MSQFADARLVELITTDRTAQELFALYSLKCDWTREQFLTELALAMASEKAIFVEYGARMVCASQGVPWPPIRKMNLQDYSIGTYPFDSSGQ